MQPLRAHGLAEAYLYLKVTPCPDCSEGPWEVQSEAPLPAGGPARPGTGCVLHARCHHCGARRDFAFQFPAAPADGREPWGQPVNPTDRPSEIIDLGQWVSLYYLLLGETQRAGDSPEGGRLGERHLKLDVVSDHWSLFSTAALTSAENPIFSEAPEK